MSDTHPSKSGSGLTTVRIASLTSVIGQFFGRFQRSRDDSARLRESLEEVIEESETQDRPLAREERSMMLKLLNFGQQTVADVMVPRADIIGVEASTPLGDLVRVFRDAQHSRLPVYKESLDNPIGMVHIKDLIGLAVPEDEGAPHPKVIKDILRELLFVPPSMPLPNLLVKMQATRVHLALVIDEYGGTDGLISIEDLVEQIVGEIEDEHDTEELTDMLTRGDRVFDVNARVSLEDVEKIAGARLADEEDAEEIDTLAGLVFSLVSRVPQRGEIVKHPSGVEFEVLDADPRKLKRLRIRLPKTEAGEAAEAARVETPKAAASVDG